MHRPVQSNHGYSLPSSPSSISNRNQATHQPLSPQSSNVSPGQSSIDLVLKLPMDNWPDQDLLTEWRKSAIQLSSTERIEAIVHLQEYLQKFRIHAFTNTINYQNNYQPQISSNFTRKTITPSAPPYSEINTPY